MILFTFYFEQDKLLQFSPSKRLTAEQVMSVAVSVIVSVSGTGPGSGCERERQRVHVHVCMWPLSLACFSSRLVDLNPYVSSLRPHTLIAYGRMQY
jgi:hypothetical protein